jgi:hypothetical protein
MSLAAQRSFQAGHPERLLYTLDEQFLGGWERSFQLLLSGGFRDL